MNPTDITQETSTAWIALVKQMNGWIVSAVGFIPELVIASLTMVAFYFGAKLLAKLTSRALAHTSAGHTVSSLIVTAVRTLILFFGLFTALGIMNLDKAVASLLAGAGVLGLAIGFAFQEIAANFFAGILIALRKPYREGDIVQMESFVGTVQEITLRTTNLRTFDGLEVLIPNKDMFTKAVTNFTRTPERRVEVSAGISYSEDLAKAERVALAALEPLEWRIQDRPVEFFFTGFGDSTVNFQVRLWMSYTGKVDFMRAKHLTIVALKKAYDENEISFPFPIRTLDFDSAGGALLLESLQNKKPDSAVQQNPASSDLSR